MMRSSKMSWMAAVLAIGAVFGCSAKEDAGGAGTAAPADPITGAGAGGGEAGNAAEPGSGNPGSSGSTAPSNTAGASGARAGGNAGASGNPSGAAGSAPPAEMLDPSVDWTALTLVYPTLYSAYDGEHVFQVPIYVDGATVELSDWSAIPSSAVSFDPEPESGGVLVTILEPVAEITIAARSGAIGGTAPLYVTMATPEQWEIGNARYSNGVEFNLDIASPDQFAMLLLDPNWSPPPPPPNLACNNCHTTGAKYFEIQHTPTQAARFSDDELRTILSMGTKPEGVGFRVLPDMLGSKTAMEIYNEYHRWESTPEEQTGLIVYLRSLTPAGQGDILLPDGTYVEPGSDPFP